MQGEENVFISALIGGGIGLAVTLLLVLILPFVALSFEDPASTALPIAVVCAFVGAVVGAFISAKKCKSSVMPVCLISAAVMLVPLTAVSFFVGGKGSIIGAALIIGAILIASLATALAVMKISGSRKRNMKKVLKRR